MRVALSIFGIPALAAILCASADKKLPVEQSSNELVEIQASLLDQDEVRKEVGTEMPGISVVRVRVRPLTEKPYKIDRDEFVLLNSNDGQHPTPFAPSQIAGNSSLVVTPQGTRGAIGNRPTFGGLGFPGGGGIGNSESVHTDNKVTMQKSDQKADSALLVALKQKVLPEKEITDPVTGLLYFQMEGKIKAKDLELHYKTTAGRISLRFRVP